MFNPVSIESWRNLFTKHGNKFAILLVLVFAIPLVISYGTGRFGGGGGGGGASSAANAAVARINGEDITRMQFESALRNSGTKPGEGYARAQGEVVDGLTAQIVIKQEAQKADAHASDAEVDRQLAQMKDEYTKSSSGKGMDWDTFLYKQIGKTPSELRDAIVESMAGKALQDKMLAAETATEADAKKQHDQVKMQLVLLLTELPQGMPMTPGAKVYSDAEAKKKAEDLLAKAKTGDIGAIAKAESADPSRTKGGDTDWRNEFSENMFGSLNYGTAFDEAVRKTEKGQFTPVVAASGMNKGYVFAKVLDRRSNLPKDFDAKKEIETLKTGRMQKKYRELIQAGIRNAKIEILDPDKKAYYDYAKYQKMEQRKQMGNSPFAAMMPGGDLPIPTQAEIDAQKALAYKELEESLKRNPEDATLNLLIGENLEKDLPNIAKNRDRIIALYETALKSTEEQETRFKLAGYYRDKSDKAKAASHYEQILRNVSALPGYDLASMQTELTTRQRLGAAFKSVDRLDLVEKSDAEVPKLMEKIKEEQEKQKAAQKQSGAMGSPPGSPISITPTDAPAPKGNAKPSNDSKTPDAKATKPAPPKGATPNEKLVSPELNTPSTSTKTPR